MGLFNFWEPKRKTGAVDDPRPQSDKDKDYMAHEVAVPRAVPWVQKPYKDWKKFEIFDQDGSGSCVAQATAKVLGVENHREEGAFYRLSARDIYTRRMNAPSEGMWFVNALDIACKSGATLESMMPSEKKNEAQMNDASDRKISSEQVGLIFKGGGYVQLPFTVDAIADAIAKGKSVLLGFRFNYDEWTSKPLAWSPSPTLHHGVAGIDFTLDGNDRCIIIDDSWAASSTQYEGRRLITQDFISKRCTFAGYVLDLSNNWRDTQTVVPRPKVKFLTDMKYGQQNDDIKKLQEMLKYEELFPVNTDITGYYGNITAKGVLEWQKRHKVAPIQELESLGGKVFVPVSRDRANSIYPLN